MSEETAETTEATEQTGQTTETAGTETQTTAAAPEIYVNSDGTLKEGWHNKYVPEEHRKDTTWLGMKNIEDLTSRISHLQGKLTTAGKGVFPINANSTPEQIKEFRQAMGIPDSPDGYTFEVPEELAKYYGDHDMVKEAQAELHKVGLTPEQFTTVMALDAKRLKASEEAMKEDPLPFYEEIMEHVAPILQQQAEEDLKKRWGDAYTSRFHYARMAIEENCPEGEQRDMLLAKYGTDPIFADFIATMQLKHHTESHGVDTSLGQGSSSQNLDQRIDAVQKQLTDELYRTNREKYNSLLSEKNKLYKQKYPEKG